jgi:alkanesulfonate monooxygenase SsuD/methylene tetrahydromethanopterin reductase-like flavin-dependent oxidoreductase (luciferase family)
MTEPRTAGSERQVGRTQQVKPAGQAIAMDLRDDWFLVVPDAQPSVRLLPHSLALEQRERLSVRGEGAAVAIRVGIRVGIVVRAVVVVTRPAEVVAGTESASRTAVKPGIALYVGGMGHPTVNFHKRVMEQQGYADAPARIEELFRAGRKEEAAETVPDEFVDEQALVGTPKRIRERYRAWAGCGITGLHIGTRQAAAAELMAEIALADEPASPAG